MAQKGGSKNRGKLRHGRIFFRGGGPNYLGLERRTGVLAAIRTLRATNVWRKKKRFKAS